jgi:hypothetical protein
VTWSLSEARVPTSRYLVCAIRFDAPNAKSPQLKHLGRLSGALLYSRIESASIPPPAGTHLDIATTAERVAHMPGDPEKEHTHDEGI